MSCNGIFSSKDIVGSCAPMICWLAYFQETAVVSVYILMYTSYVALNEQ